MIMREQLIQRLRNHPFTTHGIEVTIGTTDSQMSASTE